MKAGTRAAWLPVAGSVDCYRLASNGPVLVIMKGGRRLARAAFLTGR